MTNLTNSHSLTEFQRQARSFIDALNATREPMLLTVNGKVRAVLVDPMTYQELARQLDHRRLIDALRVSERAINEGQGLTAEQATSTLQRPV